MNRPSAGAPQPGRPSARLVACIEAARRGDREALGTALECCRRYLLRLANERLDPTLRARVAPSDVVQVTILEAHKGFSRFTGADRGDLLRWLRRALLNNLASARSFHHAARRAVSREAPMPPGGADAGAGRAPGQTPSGPLREREQKQAVAAALATLPEQYQAVIDLHHREGLSFQEIGERIGRSAEAARKLWARAVERLQEAMEDTGGAA